MSIGPASSKCIHRRAVSNCLRRKDGDGDRQAADRDKNVRSDCCIHVVEDRDVAEADIDQPLLTRIVPASRSRARAGRSLRRL